MMEPDVVMAPDSPRNSSTEPDMMEFDQITVASRLTGTDITATEDNRRVVHTTRNDRAGCLAQWATRALIDPQRSPTICRGATVPARAKAVLHASTTTPETSPTDASAPSVADLPDDVREFVCARQTIVRFVRDALQAAVDQQKAQADKRGRKNTASYAVGEKVLLSTDGIDPGAVTNLGANKLAPRFIGPFEVLNKRGEAYTLSIPRHMRLHPTFYVGRLKRYRSTEIPPDPTRRRIARRHWTGRVCWKPRATSRTPLAPRSRRASRLSLAKPLDLHRANTIQQVTQRLSKTRVLRPRRVDFRRETFSPMHSLHRPVVRLIGLV